MISIYLLKVIAVAFIPGISFRGSIPLGIGLGLSSSTVIAVSVIANILLIPVLFFGLNCFWRFVKDWRIVSRYVSRLRDKARPYVEKYGHYGMFAFVAIPVPGSGVYTGSLASWLFGIDLKRAIVPMSLGVITSAAIVSLVSFGVFSIF